MAVDNVARALAGKALNTENINKKSEVVFDALYLKNAKNIEIEGSTSQNTSPNPDFPQEIVSLRGDYNLKVIANDEKYNKDFTLTLPEMNKIGDYADKLYFDEKWKISKNIEGKILNGSENVDSISSAYELTTRIMYKNLFEKNMMKGYGLCERLPYKNIWLKDEIGFYVEQASVIFRFPKSNIGTTVNEVKNYLSENNTKIIGVLESKYDVDISSELTSQMDELVEYMSQLDLLNIDYKLIANNTIIKENIGYVEKNIISDEFEMGTLYVTGQYCIYNNKLYKCISNTDGTILPTNDIYFEYTNVTKEIENINNVVLELSQRL